MRNRYRIIGGRWRGRTIHFPALPGIRPTPDRVRVTLFDWLRPIIDGARCLDLFAGSGALGLEALSEGAALVELVDCERQVIDYLERTLASLGAVNGRARYADAEVYLRGPAEPFDIVFLDPPYDRDMLAGLCTLLEERGWLSADACVYLEQPAGRAPPLLPASWELARSKRAGQVAYYLAWRRRTD